MGIGWLVSYLVGAVALGQAMTSRTRARVVRPLLAPVSAGLVAAGCGCLLTSGLGGNPWSGLLGGLVAVLLFLTLLLRRIRRPRGHAASTCAGEVSTATMQL